MIYGSVKAFMNEIIDYAGIFPPANLTLKESFENFIDYRSYKHNWMLSKFVCPFSKLTELSELIEQNSNVSESDKLRISILGSLSADSLTFERNIAKDINDIQKFLKNNGSKVIVEAFEIKLPHELMNFRESADFIDTLNDIREKAAKEFSHNVQIFLEAEIMTEDWTDIINSLSSTLSVCNQFYLEETGYSKLGFKFRTGGVVPAAYPSCNQAAYTIMKCIENMVPFKATSGLHHPVRHFDEQANTKMHGFLNIFGAGILYYSKKITPMKVKTIIEDENPDNFKFDDDSFSWCDYKVNIEEIVKARNYMLSFGSCSFNEPRQDLKNLKILR